MSACKRQRSAGNVASSTSTVGSLDPSDQVMGLTGVSSTSSVGAITPADVIGLTERSEGTDNWCCMGLSLTIKIFIDFDTYKSLYIKNLKYAHLIPIF